MAHQTRPEVDTFKRLLSDNKSRPDIRCDMHSHFYGGGLLETLLKRDARPYVRTRDDGTKAMVAMNGEFPFTEHYFDHQTNLEQMKSTGLSHRLITFPGALGVDVLPAGEIAQAIQDYNDFLSQIGYETAGAFIGLAGLPLDDIDASCEELRRVRRDLGLPGVILPSNYFASLREMDELRPVLEAANEYGCHIMLHPGLKVGQEPPARPEDFVQYRTSAIELQSSAAQVALTIIMSDALETYPNVSFQVVNLGGTLPFIFERMESIARHRNPAAPFPTERLRNLWYDCASLGPRALEAAVKLFGADRIMLGSDFPIFKDDPYNHALTPADLSAEEKEQIAWRTTAQLICDLETKRERVLNKNS